MGNILLLHFQGLFSQKIVQILKEYLLELQNMRFHPMYYLILSSCKPKYSSLEEVKDLIYLIAKD